MGNAILTGQSGSSPPTIVNNYGFQLLSDQTVTGSAVTTVSFTGLNVGVGDELLLVADILNATASVYTCYLYANSTTTNTSYYRQQLYATSTTVGSQKINDPAFMFIPASKRGISVVNIKLTNNSYFVAQSHELYSYDSTVPEIDEQYTTSTFTATSLTRLDVTASASASIGIGSRFQLYKINGKEAKTWVTS